VTASDAANSAALPSNIRGRCTVAPANTFNAVAAATADGSSSTSPVPSAIDVSVGMMAAKAAVAAAGAADPVATPYGASAVASGRVALGLVLSTPAFL